jgi:PAS domain S-box-containing protein
MLVHGKTARWLQGSPPGGVGAIAAIGLVCLVDAYGGDLIVVAWSLYTVLIMAAYAWSTAPGVIPITVLSVGGILLGMGPHAYRNEAINLGQRAMVVGVLIAFGGICARLTRLERERRQALEQVPEPERTFTSVVQSAADAIILADEEGTILHWNAAASSMFQYSNEEALGQSLMLIIPERHREAHRRGLLRASSGTFRVVGQPVELHGWKKDGTEFPIELSLGTWQMKGTRFYSGVIRDISERQEAARRQAFQLAISHMLVDTSSIEEMAPRILRSVCELTGWDVGLMWTYDEHLQALRCQAEWQSQTFRSDAFVIASKRMTFAPNVGLPGRVWAANKAIWIPTVLKDSEFPRLPLAKSSGLNAGFGFPVTNGFHRIGIIECFSSQVHFSDQSLLDMLEDTGRKIGQFMDKQSTDQERDRLLRELRGMGTGLPLLLPICATCKNVRSQTEDWMQPEKYFEAHTQTRFTHTICDDCARKVLPDWDHPDHMKQ